MAEHRVSRIGRWAGPLGCLLILAAPTPEGLSDAGQAVAAVTLLMAVWWITEAVPIAATALLPVLLFPLLGVALPAEVTGAYGHHLVFLFLGGFMIAVTLERWNLHRRLALHTIRLVGTGPRRILLGFMLATAFLSMWISNTATVMMMVPIATAVAMQVSGAGRNHLNSMDRSHFGTALMLGIAYAASIGGIATLIGTPPNAILAGMIEQLYGTRIGFADWMAFGLPFACLFLALAWLYLARFVYRADAREVTRQGGVVAAELQKLGSIRHAERRVLMVFAGVAMIWILRGLMASDIGVRIEDSTVAVAGALLLFLLPAGDGSRLLDWETAKRIP